MENNPNIDEYIFIENIQDLFALKQATTTSWGIKFSYKNRPNENSVFIFALVNEDLKKMVFNKIDLKRMSNIYKLIRIYFGNLYVNLICNQKSTKESILSKISSSPAISKLLMEKLNIIKFPLNKFIISDFKAILENFDKVYQLEFKNNVNDNGNNSKPNMNPKTYTHKKNKSSDFTHLMIYKNQPNFNNIMNNKYQTNIIRNNNNNNFNHNSNNNMNNQFFNNVNRMNQAKSMNMMNQINQMNQFNQMNQMNMNQMRALSQMILTNNQLMLNNIKISGDLMLNRFRSQNMFQNNMQNFSNSSIPNNMAINFSLNNNNNRQLQQSLPNNAITFNRIQNAETIIDYNVEIEKNAQKYLILYEGLENDFFSKKGLNNVGLTCYMNSTLQCLLHIPELSYYFLNIYIQFKADHSTIIKKTESKGRISAEYYSMVKEIFSNSYDWLGRNSFSPKKFNDLISKLNPQFSKYESNDAKDLIIYLLQEMHEELNYLGGEKLKSIPKCNQLSEANAFNFFYEVNSKLNFSIISYLFWGIVKQTTICSGCHNYLYNYQYYQYLSFPLYEYAHKEFNLYRGLKDYISEETLKGDNQFYCQICKRLRDAKIYSKIYYTSRYLLINFDYGKNKKYSPNKIGFGAIICLTDEFLAIKTAETNYELIAVSTHLGSSGNSGHYITYCKDTSKENCWYKFNDSIVTKCDFEDTKKNSPYLLLFKKTKE